MPVRRLPVIVAGLLAGSLVAASCVVMPPGPPPPVNPVFLGRYTTGLGNGSAETVAHGDGKMFVTNTAGGGSLDVVSLADPTAPALIQRISTAPGLPNSVAVADGLVALAVEAPTKTDPGEVRFFDTDGNPLGSVSVGALPDMLTFTPDGSRVLVANEGEPNSYGQVTSVDPEGSVSVVDVSAVRGGGAATATTIGFSDFNAGGPRASELPAGVRIFGPGATVAQDLEPEYIAVHPDGTRAWVTLQENNAIAHLDLVTNSVIAIFALGQRDESLPGNGLDASDQDSNPGNIQNWPVQSMYQPDSISVIVSGGVPYLVSANEGDARDYTGLAEEIRVGSGSYVLDPTVFPTASTLKQPANLGRLTVSRSTGNLDTDSQYERIDLFGSRSFSVWNGLTGAQVYDSGDDLEQLTKATYPSYFNANNDSTTPDTRSDNKGPEPEGTIVIDVDGRPVAFVCLERQGGVAVYDMADPTAPVFNDYVSERDFTVAAGPDSGPEAMGSVPASENPTGRPLLLVAHEISGTVAVYRL